MRRGVSLKEIGGATRGGVSLWLIRTPSCLQDDLHDEPLGGEKWQKVPSASVKENR